MVITYLHQYFNTLEMSGGTRSYEMARSLVERGHIVHMITSIREPKHNDNKKWVQTVENGIHVHWYPVPYANEMPYGERIRAFFAFSYKAASRAAGIKSDVVFATSTPLTIAIPAVYASKKLKVPMVFEVRDLWPEGPIAVGALKNPLAILAARWLERFAYRNSVRIIALSPGMKQGVVATGYPDKYITVIPNGCDLDLFSVEDEVRQALRSEHAWLQERPLVIYAGTLGLVNGVDYLARLASAVFSIDQEVRFVILGSGREEASLKIMASRLGVLDRNLFMLPAIPKYQMPAWLAAADIVTPTKSKIPGARSYWMDSQNKFFDALAAGKPIAMNYGGWQTDLLKEINAGLELDVDDIDSAAAKLVSAIRNREWLEQAGAASRRLAETYFNRDQLAGLLEEVLEQAIERQGDMVTEK